VRPTIAWQVEDVPSKRQVVFHKDKLTPTRHYWTECLIEREADRGPDDVPQDAGLGTSEQAGKSSDLLVHFPHRHLRVVRKLEVGLDGLDGTRHDDLADAGAAPGQYLGPERERAHVGDEHRVQIVVDPVLDRLLGCGT